jgi:tetratricopeptide (TPR) repeat protein
MFDAYEVFSKTDTESLSRLNTWIKEYSEVSPPYIARAKYYCARARQARGSKQVADKDQKEYKDMEQYYSLALTDINIALKKNPRVDVCYAMVVEIGSAIGHEEVKRRALTSALKNHPYAYRVRLKYLQTLTPRRGGSYEIMEAFIDSCDRLAAFNPKLKELRASIPADKGSFFSYVGKYEEAVKMWTEVLQYSQSPSSFADRADAYVHLHDYVHALNDYDHALELSPNDPEYLSRKAAAIASRTGLSQAQSANQYKQRNDSADKRTQDQSLISDRTEANDHLAKGNNFANAEKYEEAINEYSEVIRIVPYEYLPYYNRALCYSHFHNDDAALQDFLRVVELKPDDMEVYPRMTEIYANRGMYDDAIICTNKWLSINPQSGEALFNRAKVFERKGSNIEALNDMRQACDLGYQPACRYYNQVQGQ